MKNKTGETSKQVDDLHIIEFKATISPQGTWSDRWNLPTEGRLVRCKSLVRMPSSILKVTRLQHANINGLWPEDERDWTQVFSQQPIVAPGLSPANIFELELQNRLTNQTVGVSGQLIFDVSKTSHPLCKDFLIDPPGMFENDYEVHKLLNQDACSLAGCLYHLDNEQNVIVRTTEIH